MFENGANGAENGSRGRVAAAVATAVLAGLLGAAWLWVRADAVSLEEQAKREAEKLEKAKAYIQANYETLVGRPGGDDVPSPLSKKPLLSIVKDLASQCGMADRIARVVEEENQKLGELTAKVTFRRVRIADVVNFLSVARRDHPGLWDREARMRYDRGDEADNWEVTLSLTARKPKP